METIVTKGVKIWTFGLRPPSAADEAVINDLMSKSHAYHNNLIENEKKRRDRYCELRREHVGDFEALEKAYSDANDLVTAARAEIKLIRKEKRARVEVSDGVARVKALIEERKVHKKALAEARAEIKALTNPAHAAYVKRVDAKMKELGSTGPRIRGKVNAEVRDEMLLEPKWPEFWKRTKEAEAEAHAKRLALRAACGLPSGTYLMVEQAVDAATKKPNIRFRRWNGEGRIGVQLRDVTGADVFSNKSNMLQIDSLPDNQWDTRPGRRRARAEVRIRVGSAEGQKPIWARFGGLIHRRVPPECSVKWAWIKITRQGNRRRYELQMTMKVESRRPVGEGTVAVDLGWRIKEDGDLRVAYAVDDSGNTIELVLPERMRTGMELVSRLSGHGDDHHNAARAVLINWMKFNKHPEWLAEATEHIAQWRAPSRLAALVTQMNKHFGYEEQIATLWDIWLKERLAATPKLDLHADFAELRSWLRNHPWLTMPDVAVYLEWWRRKNEHLYQWASDVRGKILRRRRDIYRVFAHKLTAYEKIIVEDANWADLNRNAAPEESAENDHLHRWRNLASPGDLRLKLSETGRMEKVKTAYSTRDCHLCGHRNEWEEKPVELYQTCQGCHETWDQDYNAAKILLTRPEEEKPIAAE